MQAHFSPSFPREALQWEAEHTSGFFSKRPLNLVAGEGASIWDETGAEYIDCVAGQGVALLGHGNLEVAGALAQQAGRLATCSEGFFNPVRGQYLKRLAQLMPETLKRFYLCNSGTEAVEAALKIARLVTGRTRFVAARRGFHGRTMGALSATWQPRYREAFEPLVPGFSHVPFNDVRALQEAVDGETAAIILEPIQGEGGVYPATREFLQEARELASRRGALLILDEIQTGFGRTGSWFAMMEYGVLPDLLCLAKGMGGGLPMGAVAIAEQVGELEPRSHGSTAGGNPLACAAALATLEVLERDNLPQRAAQMGEYFFSLLQKEELPGVVEIRGKGLMVGVQLRRRVAPVLQALQEQGVLALAAGNVTVRFLPPLVISAGQLETVAITLGGVLRDLA